MTSYTVAEKAQIFTFVPDRLLDLLAGHLPTSLTILRRLQFASYTNLSSHDSHIVFSSDIGTLDNKSTKTKHFAVTFVDLLGGPDTQMWFYSSMEAADYENLSQSELHIHETHIMKCVYALVQIRKRFACDLAYGNSVLLGSLHSEVCKILIKNKRILPLPSGKYDKWLFKVQDIPSWDMPLWEGMYWAEASLGDCQIAASRTDLPRPPYVQPNFVGPLFPIFCAYLFAALYLLITVIRPLQRDVNETSRSDAEAARRKTNRMGIHWFAYSLIRKYQKQKND